MVSLKSSNDILSYMQHHTYNYNIFGYFQVGIFQSTV